jgi:thioredoxin reductase (NADPH)
MSISQINNTQEFQDLTKTSTDFYLLDFYADWCGPCKIMMPIFERLSNMDEFSSLKFAKINRDQNSDIMDTYGFHIKSIPQFVLIKFNADGVFNENNIIDYLGGTQSKTDLSLKLTQLANENAINLTETSDATIDSQSMHENKQKVAIIGSGPSGLTAGIYTSRAQLDTTIYLGLQPGGQLTTTTEIENFPGAWSPETKEGMMGPDLMALMQKQAEHFGAKTILDEVNGLIVGKNSNGKPEFTIKTSSSETKFDAVIIASGASAKYLGVPGEEQFIGKGYHSCATCDGFFYRGKTVAIVGGGDSSMEEANFLTKFAQKVYIIHRREEFRASKIMLERAKNNPKIEFLLFKKIVEFIGEKKVESVTLEDTKTGEKSNFPLDAVFVAIGHNPNTEFLGDLLDKDNSGYLIPQSRIPQDLKTSKYGMATKVEGVFVAGDVEDKTYRQAITAAGDGCRAAMDTEKWLEEISM